MVVVIASLDQMIQTLLKVMPHGESKMTAEIILHFGKILILAHMMRLLLLSLLKVLVLMMMMIVLRWNLMILKLLINVIAKTVGIATILTIPKV